jgi:pimeloyl-ACP methyl ester carboxylesterase
VEPTQTRVIVGDEDGRPLEMACWDNGRRGRTTLLLLHGLFDHKGTWEALWPCLDDRYRLVAVDLIGFGHSSKPRLAGHPPSYPYSAAMHAEHLRGLIEALALDSLILVGHSLGGGIALYACCTRPEVAGRVRGLVLIAPAAYPQELPPYARWLAGWPGRLLQHRWAQRAALAGGLAERGVRLTVGRVFHDPRRVPPTLCQRAVDVLRTDGVFYAYRQAVLNIVPPDHAAVIERFGRIACPSLLVWGRQDRVVPAGFADRLVGQLPAARLHLAEPCGHAPHLECPDRVAHWIAEWDPTSASKEEAPCPSTPS